MCVTVYYSLYSSLFHTCFHEKNVFIGYRNKSAAFVLDLQSDKFLGEKMLLRVTAENEKSSALVLTDPSPQKSAGQTYTAWQTGGKEVALPRVWHYQQSDGCVNTSALSCP